MKLDINGINLIAELEGLKLKAYKDLGGIWTIGFGNTFYADGSKVKEGDVVTKEQAYYLFHLIATKFEKTINDNVKKPLTQNQFNSLFCFCYNLGQTAFINSTLLKLVNINPTDANIAKEFLKWNKIARVESKGLTNRRIKESALYYTKILFVLFLLTSCGTRKVQKSDTTEDIKAEVNVKVENNIKKSSDSFTEVVDNSEIITIEAIDTINPLIIGGVTYKNARLSYVKNKIRTNTTSKETVVDKGYTKVKEQIKVNKEQIKVNKERTTNPLLYLIFPLVIGIMLIFGKKFL